ncbi:MAG: dephospho-CoA kinase [Bacteroidales bacterium]|nr:dephospho-CoA kinase [Bacteroidales bacterium]MCF8456453.1 dephospho-CoA kinase [Bacteroidales bacterium]
MIKVGITGGIGSGKSLVCEIFKCLGVPVFNSDMESKNLLSTNEGVKKGLIHSFGAQIYSSNGEIDKAVFASIIFSDEDNLRLANSIIHPAVASRFHDWCEEQERSKYVLKEAAILFESGAYKQLDLVIAILAHEAIRIERIKKRDNSSEIEIRKRIDKQWPDEKINSMADFVIQNSGNKLLIPQVLEIHKKLINDY